MLAHWAMLVAFAVMLGAFFVEGGAPLGSWVAYPPLSALGEIAGPGQGMGMNMWILSIAIFCIAALLGSLNLRALAMVRMLNCPIPRWAPSGRVGGAGCVLGWRVGCRG